MLISLPRYPKHQKCNRNRRKWVLILKENAKGTSRLAHTSLVAVCGRSGSLRCVKIEYVDVGNADANIIFREEHIHVLVERVSGTSCPVRTHMHWIALPQDVRSNRFSPMSDVVLRERRHNYLNQHLDSPVKPSTEY